MFGLISFCACLRVSFSILFCSGGVEPGGLGVGGLPRLPSSWLAVLEHPEPPWTLPKMLKVGCRMPRGTRGLWSVFGGQDTMASRGLLLGGGGLGETERCAGRARYESHRQEWPGEGLCMTLSVRKTLETTARWSHTRTCV